MSLRSLEAEILKELRIVAKDQKLRQKDIMEWSTGDVERRDGEKAYRLPKLGVNVAVLVKKSDG